MARRGANIKLEPFHQGINESHEEDNIYENQSSLKQDLNNSRQRPPCIGQEEYCQPYEGLHDGNNTAKQETTYEMFDEDKNGFVTENYEHLQSKEGQAYNNSQPETDTPGDEDLYDDVITSKASKNRAQIVSGESSHVINNSECVSTKAFQCCSLIILFIFLIAVSSLILVILIIYGIISINTCACESDIDIKKLDAQISALQACPSGWRYFQNSCYYMVSKSITLSNANKSCISLQSKLVSIETKEENDFVTRIYLQCSPASSVSKAWLGLMYQGMISTQYPMKNYKWDSGQSIGNSTTFFNETKLFTKTCFRVQHDRIWYSTECGKTYAGICEGPPAKVSSCHIP